MFRNSILTLVMILTMNTAQAQLNLVSDGKSDYVIIIPQNPSAADEKAAAVLQTYLRRISGASLAIRKDSQPAAATEICIGKTSRTKADERLINDGFVIKTSEKRLFIYGNAAKSALYGVYHFLESQLGCRKYTAKLQSVPQKRSITIGPVSDVQNPQFSFRQVYYPDQYDEEFRDWHKLHLLEDVFGLWGHTFDKLVPAAQYFRSHPEYYALVNGKRSDAQLCLSNPAVFDILVENLSRHISDDPEKKIWSVSQNDGMGYCTCDKCRAVDARYGGPQGSVISFVNKVAARFPDKTISTLAYLYSARPPVGLKPAKNVSVLYSSIALDRGRPIATNPRAASLRNDLKAWAALTEKLMVWDYVVQFTNYQSPFPNIDFLQPNMNYFGGAGVTGIFAQGTESSPGEFSALKTYLLAKLSWSPADDVSRDREEFMEAYYGKASPLLTQYNQELGQALGQTNRVLDIYGDPVSEWNSWLTPEHIDSFSAILDKAQEAVKNEPEHYRAVTAERLALEYAVLQQARFYGIGRHGMFVRNGSDWSVRPGFEIKVQRFIAAARASGLKEIAEGGPDLDEYAAEWKKALSDGPILHQAIGAQVNTIIPFSDEYPGKGSAALTDGSRGYDNFQYNYLGWHGTDMEVVVDLGSVKEINAVSAGFLEDQRHWAFLPLSIGVQVSEDNKSFSEAAKLKLPATDEVYTKETHRYKLDFETPLKARYIRLRAENLKTLPEWRDFPNRKSWLFCDEVAVY